MLNLFSGVINRLNSFLKSFRVKQLLSIALIAVMFLIAPAETPRNNPDLGREGWILAGRVAKLQKVKLPKKVG